MTSHHPLKPRRWRRQFSFSALALGGGFCASQRCIIFVCSISCAILACLDIATAQTKTWDRGASTDAWQTANNWNSNGVPSSTNDILLDNSSVGTLASQMTTSGLTMTVQKITFDTSNTVTLGNTGTGSGATSSITLSGSGGTLISLTNAATGTFSIIPQISGNRTLTLTLSGSGDFNVTNAAGTLSISAAIGQSGTQGITKTGAGTLTLGGANTFTGVTSITAGKLLYGASNVISTGGVTVNGATAILDLANNQSDTVGTVTLDGGGSINGTGTSALTVNSTDTFEVKGGSASVILAGTAALNKTTSGTVTLSGVNTYTGATTITAGNLAVSGSIASGSTVGVATAGTLSGTGTVNGNATLTGGGIINFTNPGKISGTLGVTGGNWNGNGSVSGLTTASSGTFTIGAGANFTADGNLNVTGGSIAAGNASSTVTGSVNYTSGSNSSFAGVIAGAGKTVTLNNAAATLTLGGVNTYTGATTVTAGDLEVTGSLGAGSTVNVATGGTLSGSGTINGNVTLTGNGVIDLNNPATIGGTLAVTGGNWNGHGSVTGLVTSSSGTFTIGVGGHLTADGGVNVTGGTIVFAAPSSKIKGNVNYTSSSSSTLTGIVEGSGNALTLNNAAAVLTLSGANTYTGATTISAGTLSLDGGGSLTSAVSLLAGTLTGSGSTTGTVMIGNGSGGNDSFISPGNSPGTFTTTGAISLLSDATYAFELNSTLLTADKIVANGVSVAGATFSITDLGVAILAPGTFFTAIDNTSAGAITGSYFANLPQGGTISAGGNTFYANYFGGSGNNDLVLTVVPELGSSSLMIIGSIALGYVFRSRSRSRKS